MMVSVKFADFWHDTVYFVREMQTRSIPSSVLKILVPWEAPLYTVTIYITTQILRLNTSLYNIIATSYLRHLANYIS
jgi:hypothetical protein